MLRYPLTCSRPQAATRYRKSAAADTHYAIYEKDNAYVIELDLPGVDRESIDLQVEQQVLSVSAERSLNIPDGYTSYTHDIRGRSYKRRFELGEHIDVDSIQAAYEQGVLRVELQKKPEASPRKIRVA